MNAIGSVINQIDSLVWGWWMIILLLGTHIFMTIRTGVIQRKIGTAIRLSVTKDTNAEGEVSQFGALTTALASTIGTGNIIGISSAIALGGPGAVFWCWISGFFGMATCYAESVLSAACRKKRADGSFYGGPMYVMEQLLHNRLLAVLFSVFTVLAALCVGSGVQAHSLTAVISRRLPVSVHWIGIAAALLAGSILIGGAKKTAKVCTCLVPVMSVLYLGSCLFLLVKNAAWIPAALQAIFVSAFSKKAVIGGVAGTAVKMAVRTGMAKGLFTNEAGMGSMPMTAAAAEGLSTRDQGLVSMTGVFWDTLVMCAVTALAILSDMVKNAAPYRAAAVDEYCFVAFSNLPVAGEDLLSLCLVLFAFATIIGWSFYGECAARYLWGERGVTVFQVIYMVFVYLGSVCSLELVWNLSDLCNACMAVPNLWCLWKLKELIVEKTRN